MTRTASVAADEGRGLPAAPGDAAANAAAWPTAPQSRDEMIRVTAYLLYESQGCRPGHALEDWLAAEALVDAQLQPAAAPRAHGRAARKASRGASSA